MMGAMKQVFRALCLLELAILALCALLVCAHEASTAASTPTFVTLVSMSCDPAPNITVVSASTLRGYAHALVDAHHVELGRPMLLFCV